MSFRCYCAAHFPPFSGPVPGKLHEYPRISGQGSPARLRRARAQRQARLQRGGSGQGGREPARPGLGGEGPDPCRRPRQGRRRQGGQIHRGCEERSRAHAGHDLGHPSDRSARPRWSSGSISRTARRSSANFICRRWWTAPPAASPSSSPPKAAWTSKKWRTRRRTRSRPSRSNRRPAIRPMSATRSPPP